MGSEGGSEREQRIRRMYEHFSAGEFDAALENVDPQVEWTEPGGIPGASTFHSREEVKRGWQNIIEAWEDFAFEPQDVVESESGEHVLVRARFTGRGRESGAEAALDLFFVYRERDGRIVEARGYMEEAEARAAAGV